VSIARTSSYSTISAGYVHSLAIDAVNGMVWAWGSGNYGAIGDNSTGDPSSGTRLSPVSIARLGSYKAVAAGYYHSLAIDAATGMVWAWGYNASGQLGDNTVTNRSSPVSITRLGSYSAVAVGTSFSLAIDAVDGMVWGWGLNSSYQLGDNTAASRSSPVSICRLGSYSTIGCGDGHSLAVDASTGMIWAWGANTAGQLGDGTTTSKSSPVSIIRGGSYSKVICGIAYSMSIDATNGMVWSWGSNSAYGQLGDNSLTNRSSPVSIVRNGSYSAIAAGYHSLIIDATTGMIFGIGRNDVGQIALPFISYDPVPIDRSSSYSAIFTTYKHSFAIDAINNTVWAWGLNSTGQLGDGTTTFATSPISIGSYSKIAAGYDHSVSVDATGTVYSWGKNTYGQLANNKQMLHKSPTICLI
jgi:alpha-tubulin suppressor-like RCC1 family protein